MNTAENKTVETGQSNARAEDGFLERTSWNAFCEGILIPLSALFMACLAMTSIMLIARR